MQKFYLITVNDFPTKVFLQEEQAITFGKRMKIQSLGRKIRLYSQDITTCGMFVKKMDIEIRLTSINFTNEVLKNIDTTTDVNEFIRLVAESDTQDEYKQVILSRLGHKIHEYKEMAKMMISFNPGSKFPIRFYIQDELSANSFNPHLADKVKY